MLGVAGGCSSSDSSPAGDITLTNPIVYAAQVPSDLGEFQINDIHGNFLGDNPARDQPTGGNLFRLDPGSQTPVNLTNRTDAAVRDPEVSWDGTKIVFSMKVGATGNWQIYEIGVDGSGERRITDTPHNETEPVYMPDGRIAFISDRQRILDPYEQHPVGHLHVMNADGSGVQLLSIDPGGDMTPSITESGEIAFNRWSATIRSPDKVQVDHPDPFDLLDVSRFLLWQVTPDGDSDGHPIFGAHYPVDFQGGFVYSRPLLDGTGRFVTVLAYAASFGGGAIAIIDPSADSACAEPSYVTPAGGYEVFGFNLMEEQEDDDEGEDDERGAEDDEEDGDFEHDPAIAHCQSFIPSDEALADAYTGGRYRDPYPLTSGGFLTAYSAGEVSNTLFGVPVDYGIHVVSAAGERSLVYNQEDMWEWQPVEVVARTPPPVVEPTLDLTQATGVLNVKDVMLRGEDMQQSELVPAYVNVYAAVPNAYTFAAFLGYRQVQPALLGRAPIAPDGSFAVRVPADVPLLWETVTEDGTVVVRERFWNAVRPGQTQTCAGCHSPHDGTEGRTSNSALSAPTDLASIDLTRMIPGGGGLVPESECWMEWQTDQPRRISQRTGAPVAELECHDSDPSCDHGTVTGSCTFQVGACINVPEGRFPGATCTTGVAELTVAATANAARLIEPLRGLGPTVQIDGQPGSPGAATA
ncbi:MAG: hypothetical protein AAGC55_05130, partial [Myxococcota bacterium]